MNLRTVLRRPVSLGVALLFPITVLGFPALMERLDFDGPTVSALAWVVYIALFGFSVNAACRHIYAPAPERAVDPAPDDDVRGTSQVRCESRAADGEIHRLLSLRRHRGRYSVIAATVGLLICGWALLRGDAGVPGLGLVSTSYTVMLLLAWLAVSLAASDRAVHDALARRDGDERDGDERAAPQR